MSTNQEVKDQKMFRLTDEQFDRLTELLDSMRDGTTWNEAFERIFNQGLYQVGYRYGSEAKAARKAYNKKHAGENKQGRALLKRAQRDPELAVRLGLGTQPEL